jgi:hypothetical protein
MISTPEQTDDGGGVAWTATALERLEKVPEFVRPMARAGIERYARENGLREIDDRCSSAPGITSDVVWARLRSSTRTSSPGI